MKITRIDTVHWKRPEDAPWFPNWTWVRIHTESGHAGLGETYPRSEAEAALCIGLAKAATKILAEMATFKSAGVTDRSL